MKKTFFSKDYEDFKRVRKFSNKLKKKLYALYIPHTITGCCTSPTYYIHLVSMQHKDKVIRISNHLSKDPFYKSSNVYNVIIKNDIDNEWIDNKLNNIQEWLEANK